MSKCDFCKEPCGNDWCDMSLQEKLKRAIEVIEFYASVNVAIHGVEWEEGGEYAREFLKEIKK